MSPRHRLPPAQVADLWPAPAQVSVSRATRAGQIGYLVMPSLSRPRLLVPMEVSDAGRMLRRHGGSRAERTARSLLRLLNSSGVGVRLPITRLTVTPEPEGIEAYLGACLSRSVTLGVLLGPPRANAKPVLQVFDESGTTIAFAKVGANPLTAGLVDNEATALASLERLPTRTFSAPRLLHHGRWHQVPVLVQQALALSQSDLAPVRAPIAVMAEIAEVAGIRDQRLGDSDFLSTVAPGMQTSWHGVDILPFQHLHATLSTVGGFPFGSWHGDFGPWNMGTNGTRFEVWDWERFDAAVPVGFDAAHYRTQEAFGSGVEPLSAWTDIVGDVSTLLRTLSLDPDHATTAAGCYLLAICSRYRRDADDGPTENLLRRMRWLSATAIVAVRSLDEAFA